LLMGVSSNIPLRVTLATRPLTETELGVQPAPAMLRLPSALKHT
jgi:hypothetical protein